MCSQFLPIFGLFTLLLPILGLFIPSAPSSENPIAAGMKDHKIPRTYSFNLKELAGNNIYEFSANSVNILHADY